MTEATQAIEKLKAMLEAATPGEWQLAGDEQTDWNAFVCGPDGKPVCEAYPDNAANAAFIAAAKNAMGPALACIEAASKLSAALYLDQSNISTASRQAYGETFRALASFTAALEGQTNG